jgi:hypothetical protein
MKHILAACLAGALALGCHGHGTRAASPEPPRVLPTSGLFRFHVDFWPNLHETLFHESLLPKPGFSGPKSLAHVSVAPLDGLAPAEAAVWHDAVGYYDTHFSTKDTFTPELVVATRVLGALGSETKLSSSIPLDPAWTQLLSHAAPVYRAHFWQGHEESDEAYVVAIRRRLLEHGDSLAKRLSTIYETAWPSEPIDVDVTAVVPPFGASTIGEPPFDAPHAPLITVSSMDPGYTGDTGLEMLFHESSHLLVDHVKEMLEVSAKDQGRTLPPRFWHFLLFYTAGHVTRERLGRGYVPYAERPEHQIFEGDFARYLPILEHHWQPYLDERVTLQGAVDALVGVL